MAATTERLGIRTTGVLHTALRSSDLRRARIFYIERLGFPLLVDGADQFTFAAGGSAIRVLGPSSPSGTDEERGRGERGAGLDHIALACSGIEELRRAASALSAAGIEHSGFRVDAALRREYVAFDDPDGIGWELYAV
jgi:glyoxylase I family protein